MITFKNRGSFEKTEKKMKRRLKIPYENIIKKYADEGLEALIAATPVRTGLTANSWYYKISNDDGKAKISYCNSNIQNGVLIAIIIQNGHATKNGGWVEGIDYINPAIKPVIDKIVSKVRGEVM